MLNTTIKCKGYNLLTRIVGEMHIGKRTRMMHVLKTINTLNPNGKIILDAGCAEGDYVFLIATEYPFSTVEGIELDENSYEKCKKRSSLLMLPNVSFIQQNLCQPFGRSRYDLIYSIDVLEHIEDDDKVLRNMFLALRSQGQIIIHVPLVNNHIFRRTRNMPRQPDHVRDGYEEKDLLSKIRDNGFLILEKKYTFSRYRGGLGWEIWKLFSQMSILAQLMVHPLVVFLSRLDGVTTNRIGGGILILAQKPMNN